MSSRYLESISNKNTCYVFSQVPSQCETLLQIVATQLKRNNHFATTHLGLNSDITNVTENSSMVRSPVSPVCWLRFKAVA